MAKFGSATFPFVEDHYQQSLKRTTTVNDTIASAMRCFLVTSPGQRRGNRIGSKLPSLKQQLIPSSSLPQVADDIKAELVTQFPGVNIISVNLTQTFELQVVSLDVRISFSTAFSEIANLNFLI